MTVLWTWRTRLLIYNVE